MGMAATQARLLTITARMHDIEYQAQALQNAKVQLSTQSDQVYQEYLEALDATTLTVLEMDSAGNKNLVAATFNNLCGSGKVQAANGKNYALFDKRGRLIVEDKIAKGYKDFQDSDMKHLGAEGFAMYMLGIRKENAGEGNQKNSTSDYGVEDAIVNAYGSISDTCSDKLIDAQNKVMSILKEVTDNDITMSEPKHVFDHNDFDSVATDEQKESYNNALNNFIYLMFQEQSEEVFNKALDNCKKVNNNEYDYDLMNYYINIYNQIQTAGSCVSISMFDDPLNGESNAANDSEWLQAMVQSGVIRIDIANVNKKNGAVTFGATSPSSDDAISYTTTTNIDKTALAKAETKYEHDLKVIDKKDKQYDMSLSKLETERSALKTQYDSLTKIIDDNVQRTFGIFNS